MYEPTSERISMALSVKDRQKLEMIAEIERRNLSSAMRVMIQDRYDELCKEGKVNQIII